MKRISSGLALIFGVVACASRPPEPHPIVFASDRNWTHHNNDPQWMIYTASSDGTELTELGPGSDPAWSWDGTKIVFESDQGAIATMSSDGTGVTVVGIGSTPAWSPDGRIVFAYDGIETMAADGTDWIQVVPPSACNSNYGTGYCEYASYSPDGSQITFDGVPDGDYGPSLTYVAQADGTAIHPLTDAEAYDPVWSPDGAQIAYVSDGAQWMWIKTEQPDRTGPATLVSTTSFILQQPDWSPDGSTIVYESHDLADPDSPGRIWVKPSDGDAHQLIGDAIDPINPQYDDTAPKWWRGAR